MKLSVASALLAIASTAAAFSPASVPSANTALKMSAVETELYTFEKSEEIFAEAKELMPGGVSSPVRAFKSVGGNPVVFDRVKGPYAWDVDDNKYIDYVGTWGPAILGHADDDVLAAAKATLCAEYNNLDSVRAIFDENPDEIAAVILEPVVGNSGFIKPDKAFLEGVRALCTEHGAVCVFDEVMTGFRVAYGGAQSYFGVTPDLTTMGKVIGGGLPVGAYGGKREIMEMVAPAGPMYQAGTLSGNPLAMTAGIETMKKLAADGVHEDLERKSKRLVDGIVAAAEKHGLPISGDYAGGMFGWYFTEGPVKNFQQAAKADADLFGRWHRMMLERGVYLAPSMYEAGFMSMAHTDEDIDRTIAIADEVMAQL